MTFVPPPGLVLVDTYPHREEAERRRRLLQRHGVAGVLVIDKSESGSPSERGSFYDLLVPAVDAAHALGLMRKEPHLGFPPVF
jgi:hypothetical protein